MRSNRQTTILVPVEQMVLNCLLPASDRPRAAYEQFAQGVMSSFHVFLPARKGNLVLQKHWIRKRVAGQGHECRQKYAIPTKISKGHKVMRVNTVGRLVSKPMSITGSLSKESAASALEETRGTIQLANMILDYV